MRIILAEELVDEISRADCADALHSALATATRRMGFHHFALSYDRCAREMPHPALLVHDYPDHWARIYVGFNLGGRDPVRRACEKTMTGFAWKQLDRLIPLTRGDRQMLIVGRENGIGDGYTVPRHLPGEASGSCTFVVGPDTCLPHSMLHVAELVGAFGLASARRMTCVPVQQTKPVLSERQQPSDTSRLMPGTSGKAPLPVANLRPPTSGRQSAGRGGRGGTNRAGGRPGPASRERTGRSGRSPARSAHARGTWRNARGSGRSPAMVAAGSAGQGRTEAGPASSRDRRKAYDELAAYPRFEKN